MLFNIQWMFPFFLISQISVLVFLIIQMPLFFVCFCFPLLFNKSLEDFF